MMKIIKISLLLTLAILATPTKAQLVTIETVVDTNVIELGRVANLTYVVTKKTTGKVYLPIIVDTIAEGVEVLGEVSIDSALNGESQLIQQHIPMTSFEEGMYYIEPKPFVVETEFGFDTLFSKDTYLKVVGVQLDTTGVIREIKNVEHVKWTFKDYLPYLLVVLGIALILLFIFVLLPIIRKKNGDIEEAIVVEPAHVIALRELDKLKAQKLWQQEQVKEYYSILTGVIRKYLENQFSVQAMEETTREILRDIKLRGLDANMNMKDLEGLLNLADLIKFAKWNANPEENMEQLENAYHLVKDTQEMEVQSHSSIKVREDDEFVKFVFSGIDHGIDSVKSSGAILVPFVMTRKGEDQKIQRFVSDDYQESIKLAENHLKKMQPRPDWALLAYENTISIEGKKNKAVYVKGYDKKELKGLTFVQRFQPNDDEYDFQKIGNPALIGKEENVLRQVSGNKLEK